MDLFATRFNNKPPPFVSLVPDPVAWVVDSLSLSWEDLDPCAFQQVAILGKVVEKLEDYPCNRMILIAPEWPTYLGFGTWWPLSSQIPLCFPNLSSLKSVLHAWLLGLQLSRTRTSLRQWQYEFRLLKEDQPDESMRQSGPFLQSGASVIRCTSGHSL